MISPELQTWPSIQHASWLLLSGISKLKCLKIGPLILTGPHSPNVPFPTLPSSVNGIICSGQKPRSHPRFLFPSATPLTRFCWLCLQNTSQYKTLSSLTCTTAMAFFPAPHSLCSILHTDARVIPFSCCLKPLNSSHLESKIQIPYIPYSGPPSPWPGPAHPSIPISSYYSLSH